MELGKADPSLRTKLRMYTLIGQCVCARVCGGGGGRVLLSLVYG